MPFLRRAQYEEHNELSASLTQHQQSKHARRHTHFVYELGENIAHYTQRKPASEIGHPTYIEVFGCQLPVQGQLGHITGTSHL